MDIEKQATQEMWLMLKTLKKSYLLTASRDYVEFEINENKEISNVPPDSQRRILRFLHSEGAIKVHSNSPYKEIISLSFGVDSYGGIQANFYRLELIPEKFEILYKKYSDMQGEQGDTSELNPIPHYFVKFTGETKRVILNDKYILSTPRFHSENYLFIEYAIRNSGRDITKHEIQTTTKHAMGKSFHQTINDLGFKGPLRKIFFPNVSGEAFVFRDTVTKKEFDSLEINEADMKELKQTLSSLKLIKK